MIVHEEIGGAFLEWRERLRRWLDEQEPPPAGDGRTVEEQVLLVLAWCRTVTRGIGETLPAVTVLDHTKYEHLEAGMRELLALDELSLVEVSFQLPEERRPGLRLWLTGPASGRRIELIFFEDVLRWRVDSAGRKISLQLLTLELGREEIMVSEGQGFASWRDHLVEALCAPAALCFESL